MSNKKNAASGEAKRSLLVILMVILALGACGFAGYTFWEMKKLKNQSLSQEGGATPKIKELTKVDPLYISLNTFTVSLKPTPEEGDRVLYLGVSLRLDDRQSQQTIEKFLPEYRSRLFMLLAQLTYEELITSEGKQKLIASIKNEVSKPLAFNQSAKASDVLFNEFILR